MPSKKENIPAASAVLSLGLDIGSTTAKIVLMEDGEVLYQRYERHFPMCGKRRWKWCRLHLPF